MRFVELTVVLALATSLDSLGVGVAFGLNGTRIRLRAHAIISVVMLAITALSVALGNRLTHLMPESDARWLSAALFVLVGMGMLLPMVRSFRTRSFCHDPNDKECCPLRLAEKASEVRIRDAFGLGFLLSINNVGGGISAGLIHLSPMDMGVLSVVFNVLCILIGHKMGRSSAYPGPRLGAGACGGDDGRDRSLPTLRHIIGSRWTNKENG